MPVIIKELIIRATVDDKAGTGRNQGRLASPNADERKAIVKACYEQVMAALARQKRP